LAENGHMTFFIQWKHLDFSIAQLSPELKNPQSLRGTMVTE